MDLHIGSIFATSQDLSNCLYRRTILYNPMNSHLSVHMYHASLCIDILMLALRVRVAYQPLSFSRCWWIKIYLGCRGRRQRGKAWTARKIPEQVAILADISDAREPRGICGVACHTRMLHLLSALGTSAFSINFITQSVGSAEQRQHRRGQSKD